MRARSALYTNINRLGGVRCGGVSATTVVSDSGLGPSVYYKFLMKTIEQWLLYKYVEGEFVLLSKPFKTKAQAEQARLKLPKRDQRGVGVGVVRRKG
jgi:hypothetical protein